MSTTPNLSSHFLTISAGSGFEMADFGNPPSQRKSIKIKRILQV